MSSGTAQQSPVAPWIGGHGPASSLDATLGPLLVRAGRESMSRFRAVTVQRKADRSPVTEADLAAERVLVDGLAAAFPEDGILGEEGASRPGGPGAWVVDPIDGTSAFAEGLSHWGPVVARLEGGRVTAGGLWLPRLSEYYYFEAGLGAFRDGAPLPSIGPALEPSHKDGQPPDFNDILYIPSRLHAYATMDWPGKARCLGSTAAHLCLVAGGGGVAALVGPGWRAWDTALGLALIDSVGGAARLPDGRPLQPEIHEGRAFIAGTRAALDWLTTPGRLAPRHG